MRNDRGLKNDITKLDNYLNHDNMSLVLLMQLLYYQMIKKVKYPKN